MYEERRLAAIVVIDVVGYSRLMGQNEGLTLAAFNAHRIELIHPKVVEHRGRIVRSKGDGLLLEFASAVDAVRCAVDIQRGMAARNAGVDPGRRIVFRIGINLGDVIVDGDDLFGDGINVAARLEPLADPGGICVSRAVVDQVVDKLNFGFEPRGAHQVKNIVRPVEIFSVSLDEGAAKSTPRRHQPKGVANRRRELASAAVGAFALVAALALWELYPRLVADVGQPAQADVVSADQRRPFQSMAVMPFTVDASHDDGEEKLARRLGRDFTVAASRNLQDGLVLSPGLVDHYRNTAGDPRQIGRELNVRYVVEGTLHRAANEHQLSVRLIDSISGALLWTERLPIATADPTDSIARAVNALSNALERALRSEIRALPSQQRRAWELLYKARDLPESIDGHRQQEKLYEEALRTDPNLVYPLLHLALIYYLRIQNEPEQRAELLKRFDAVTSRATALSPLIPDTWTWRAYALALQGNWSGAFAASDEAQRIDPYRPISHVHRAGLLVLSGNSTEALRLLERARELDPQARVNVWTCVAYLMLERDSDAIAPCERAAASWNYWMMHVLATAANSNAGNSEKAAAHRRRLEEAFPRFSVAALRARRMVDNPTFLRQWERVILGVRKAGVPEQ